MSRAKITAVVCEGVWHLLDGTARAKGITLDYDGPLPLGRPGPGVAGDAAGVPGGTP
jgi:hypothetical protein